MTDRVSDDHVSGSGEEHLFVRTTGGILAPRVELTREPMFAGVREWCRSNPMLCGTIGFGLLVVGGLVFLSATGSRNVGISVLLALIAAATGAFGLLLLNEPIAAYVKANVGRGRSLGFLGLVVGVAVVLGAVIVRSPLVAVIGAVVVLLGLLALNAWLLVAAEIKHSLLLSLGIVLLAAAPLLMWFGDGVDWWAVGAVVLWVPGLVLFKVGLPPWIDEQPRQRRWAVIVDSLLAVALGAALLYWSARTFDEPTLLFGLALPIVGLSALGIGLARFEPGRARAWIPLLVGLVMIGGGMVLTQQIVGLIIITVVASLVVASVGAWFVFRGEALIAVLLVGFVVAWVLVDRVSPEPEDPFPTADLTLLAVGDSFISGEGAPRFFEGTNTVGPNNFVATGDRGNQCRRAPTAYPYLVARRLEAGLIFLACSGATTEDMDNQGDQREPFPEVAGGEDQLQRLLAVEGIRVADLDAVLVSVGGNDVGFGAIIQACLLPQSCAADDRVDRWLRNVEEVRPTLAETYRTVKDVVGDDVPVVAVPYPVIVRPDEDCRLAIDDGEIAFVTQFTNALNDAVRQAAAEAGVNVFEASIDAFDGRLLCDDDPATNFFHLGPTDGPIADIIVPSNWVHGSLHPRASGHELLADRLASEPTDDRPSEGYLVDLLATTADGQPANPDPVGSQPDSTEQPDLQELPDEQWIRERLFETAADLVAPLGLLLAGGLVAAFGLIKTGLLIFLDPSNNRSRT